MTKPKPNNLKRSPIATSIVLHDFSVQKTPVWDWLNYNVEVFRRYNLEPTRMGVAAPDIKSKSTVTFKGGLKRLERANPETLIGVEIYATPPRDDEDHSLSLCSASIDAGTSGARTSLFCIDSDIQCLEREAINNLIKEQASVVKPNYGYVFQRPYKLGPTWYPFGISCNIDFDDPESDLIDKWGKWYSTNSSNKYKTGDMRDIYPVNILSQAHQRHVVDGLPLFDWIQADKARGHVDQLDTSLWAWWVDPDSIPIVREALRPLGWVVAI